MSSSNKIPRSGDSPGEQNLLAICDRWVDDGSASCLYAFCSLEDPSVLRDKIHVPQEEIQGGGILRRGDRVVLDLVWINGVAHGQRVRRRERYRATPPPSGQVGTLD